MARWWDRVQEYLGLEGEADDESLPLEDLSRSREGGRQIRRPGIFVSEPENFDGLEQAGIAFRRGDVVCISLNRMGSSQRQRCLDFMAGLVHGLCGGMRKVADNAFVLTPEGSQVSGEGDDSYHAQSAPGRRVISLGR
ncbi:MAG: cell division protein SepF [Actinomycetota bacterium]|jgi:cell division inhibitor SepF